MRRNPGVLYICIENKKVRQRLFCRIKNLAPVNRQSDQSRHYLQLMDGPYQEYLA